MGRGHQEYSQDLQNMWNGSKKLCRKQYSSSKNHREMKKVFIRLPYLYEEEKELSIGLFPICIPVKVDPANTSREECRLVRVSLVIDNIYLAHYCS